MASDQTIICGGKIISSNVGGGGRGLGSMDRIETAPPPRGERNDEFTLDELQKKIYN